MHRWIVLSAVLAVSLSGCSSSGSIGGQLDSQRFDQIGAETATVMETTRQLVGLSGWESIESRGLTNDTITAGSLSVGTSANAGVNCVNWTADIQVQGDVDSVALKQKLTDYWESLGLSVSYLNDDEATGEFYMGGRGSGDSVIKTVSVMVVKNVTPPAISVQIESVCIPGEYGPTVRSVNGSPDAG